MAKDCSVGCIYTVDGTIYTITQACATGCACQIPPPYGSSSCLPAPTGGNFFGVQNAPVSQYNEMCIGIRVINAKPDSAHEEHDVVFRDRLNPSAKDAWTLEISDLAFKFSLKLDFNYIIRAPKGGESLSGADASYPDQGKLKDGSFVVFLPYENGSQVHLQPYSFQERCGGSTIKYRHLKSTGDLHEIHVAVTRNPQVGRR